MLYDDYNSGPLVEPLETFNLDEIILKLIKTFILIDKNIRNRP